MLSTDLKVYAPANTTNTSAHGGRASGTIINLTEVNNVFPDVDSEQLATGLTIYRKLFLTAADDGDGMLKLAKAFFRRLPGGNRWTTLFAGTDTDILSDIAGYATGQDTKTKYGIAAVTTNVVAGTRTIKVTIKSNTQLSTGDDEIYRVGEKIRLGKTGTEELLEIYAIAESDLDITITTTADIANNYAVTDAPWCSSVDAIGTLQTSSAVVGHTGGADYDAATYAPVLDNIGTVRQRLVLTFSDSVNFTCVGDSLGGLGTGSKNADFVATNTARQKPLCTLLAGGWAGLTMAAGDTFTLDIFAAAAPVWEKYTIPPGDTAISEDLQLSFTGEPA